MIDQLLPYIPAISGPRDAAGRNRVFFFTLPDTGVHQIDPEIEVRWRFATMYGFKTYDGDAGTTTDNSGSIFVGTVDDGGGNALPEEIPPGGATQYNAPSPGQSYTLRDLRFRAATAGDSVLIIYS